MKKEMNGLTAAVSGLACIIFIIVGITLCADYFNDLKEGRYYRENGGQTTATVTKARNYTETSGSRKNRSTVNYCDFTIEYTVDGEDCIEFYSHYRGRYNKGDTLTVYYLNSDPNGDLRFYLEPPVFDIIFRVLITLASVTGLAVTLVQYGRYRKRQKANNV